MKVKWKVPGSLKDEDVTYYVKTNYQKDDDVFNYSPPFHIAAKSDGGETSGTTTQSSRSTGTATSPTTISTAVSTTADSTASETPSPTDDPEDAAMSSAKAPLGLVAALFIGVLAF